MPRLTQPTLARLKRPAVGRREVPDVGTGLSIVIYASGRASYIMRFRRNGRAAKLTLGRADLRPDAKDISEAPSVIGSVLTLSSARALAADIQRQRAGGRDVIAAHRTQAGASFAALARRYVGERARPNNRGWKETARVLGLDPDDDLAVLPRSVADRWSDVRAIARRDVSAVVEESRAQGIPGRSRRPGASDARARAMHSTLSPFFKWLLAADLIDADPCAGAARPGVVAARERVLTDDEVRKFWAACGRLDYPFGPLHRLLLVTGARRSEVAGMRWSELDNREIPTVWTIPAERSKNKRAHTVFLPTRAQELLPPVGVTDFVFTVTGSTAVSGFAKAKLRLDATMGSIAPWRVHDLRRTAATGMARLGQPVHVIEAVLNHKSGTIRGVAAVYNRYSYAEEKRQALEAWGSFLDDVTREPDEGIL